LEISGVRIDGRENPRRGSGKPRQQIDPEVMASVTRHDTEVRAELEQLARDLAVGKAACGLAARKGVAGEA
jgi:hypothetical protein